MRECKMLCQLYQNHRLDRARDTIKMRKFKMIKQIACERHAAYFVMYRLYDYMVEPIIIQRRSFNYYAYDITWLREK